MKAVTNDERERRRQENLRQARYHRDRGERDKAFEKYKACIKVSATLANEVAQKVRHAFRNDARVEIVQSPYEADAQLVQLVLDQKVQAVVTEDSDVLVYQAACHVPFPIIFKLDRNSGACDILSMEWLLSPATCTSAPWNHHRPLGDSSESNRMSVLDAVLKTLADRELRDPGLGARLFVQSCVLTGCDYSPNLLSGVGLVNAFKLVRNSVHRSSCDRFRHVLQQLPPKAKQSLGNKIEYEELLAKSEAVFYHHMVCLHDGTTLAFLGEHPAIPDHRHKPVMDRFGGDWSFLGDVTCCEGGQVVPGPLRDAASTTDDVQRICASVPGNGNGNGTSSVEDLLAQPNVLISNPYQKARKRQRQQPSPARKPLAAIENTADRPTKADSSNPFSKFFRQQDKPERQPDPIFAKYRVFKGDPRCVNPTNFDDIQKYASRACLRNNAEVSFSLVELCCRKLGHRQCSSRPIQFFCCFSERRLQHLGRHRRSTLAKRIAPRPESRMRPRHRQRIHDLQLINAINCSQMLQPTRFRTMGRPVDGPMRALVTNRGKHRCVAPSRKPRT
jgi:5'-3' exonuclease